MSSLKFFTILVSVFVLRIVSINCSDGFVYFKLYKCKCNLEYVYPNYTCFAKSWSRNISTYNHYAIVKKPLYELFVSIQKKSFLR